MKTSKILRNAKTRLWNGKVSPIFMKCDDEKHICCAIDVSNKPFLKKKLDLKKEIL